MALISCPTKLRYVPWTLLNVWSQRTRGSSLMQSSTASHWCEMTIGEGPPSKVWYIPLFQCKNMAIHISCICGAWLPLYGGISTFGNMAEKWDIMRLANTKAAIYIALMKSFQAGTSISKTVVELTTSFDALNTGFGIFLYSDQHTSLPSSRP